MSGTIPSLSTYVFVEQEAQLYVLHACQYYKSNLFDLLLIYLLPYLLTPWSRVLLEKLTGFAANQEIPRIL